MSFARLAAAAAALVLAACATAPAPQPFPELAGVPKAFEMSGRVAIRQGERSDIARLRWSHRPSSDTWSFASPLGNEVARIESGAQGATLVQGGGSESAPTFAQLAEKYLGVPLDPAMLAGWLHATRPAAGAGDWQVTVEETQRAGAVDLARRISATRGDVVVRLVVDEYRAVGE